MDLILINTRDSSNFDFDWVQNARFLIVVVIFKGSCKLAILNSDVGYHVLAAFWQAFLPNFNTFYVPTQS